jgi:LysM repeat protein
MNCPRGRITFVLLTLILSSGLPLAAEDAVHVVEKGETVYSISRSYSVSPGELMRYNNISDASKLQIGKRLRIPSTAFPRPIPPQTSQTGTASASGVSSSQAAVAAVTYAEHQVVRNDTLYGIARSRGISLQELLAINGFSQNHVIKIGDRIKVPAPATAQTAAQPRTNAQHDTSLRPTSAQNGDTSLRWPVGAKAVAYMTGKLYGVMVHGERSEPVKSLTQGTVISAGPYRGFGRVAIVQVNGGYLYVYGGCESLSVKEGDRIGPGTELGKLGIDAVSEKPQLFFMVYRNNTPVDPAKAPRA